VEDAQTKSLYSLRSLSAYFSRLFEKVFSKSKKISPSEKSERLFVCRGGEIRTRDFYVPNVAR
jgi:hypothetical protein